MTPDDCVMLNNESRYFYKCLFKKDAPSGMVALYRTIHIECPSLFTALDCEVSTVARIATERLDAVGIEPWLRNREQRHLLSRKLLLLTYLAETDGTHLAEFSVAKRLPCFWLWPHILMCALLGTLRMARGYIQIARYDLY
jgi:hypothetical protein